MAVILAMLGIYGVMSYSVTSRGAELGVRMAMGADARTILAVVMTDGTRLVGAGIILGLLITPAVNGLIRERLFGVVPYDPLTLAVVTALLAAVSLAAFLIPAVRASRLDPMRALRVE